MPAMVGFFAALGKAAGYTAATALLGGAILYSDGAISVRVKEHKPDGTNIYLPVPAMLASAAASFIPECHLRQFREQAGPHLPLIQAAIEGLRNSPDGELVEVKNSREYVRVVKRGGTLYVDVESDSEHVRVSLPLRTVSRIVARLAATGPGS